MRLSTLSNDKQNRGGAKLDPIIIGLLMEILREVGHELEKKAIEAIVKKTFESLSNKKGRENEVEKE